MASYRFSASVISRSAGRSATGAAAYRAGARIDCERYGTTHDFTRKGGVLHSEIMAPANAPDWMHDRAALWNAVEAAEKRKDAQLAREIQLSLPHEMTDAQRLDLVRGFVAAEFVARGMVADFAIHAPGREGDDRNHHAHVMLTMRELDGAGFGKKAREWNDTATLEHWREAWADHQNREAERLNLPFRVDHRSFEAQGIDREPEAHLGPHAANMARKDKDSRIAAENAARRERNSERAWHHVQALKELARIAAERSRFEDWAAERVGQLEAAQNLSRLDQTRALELKAERFEERLQGFYSPHLKTVEAEAAKIHDRLHARGFIATLRRAWSGRGDRERLDQLAATIADTHQRMTEARQVFGQRQQIEKDRLAGLQEERRRQQAEGIDKARLRKEHDLATRQAEAQRVLRDAYAKQASKTDAADAAARDRAKMYQKAAERPQERQQEPQRVSVAEQLAASPASQQRPRDAAAEASRALWQNATPAPAPEPAPERSNTPANDRSNER